MIRVINRHTATAEERARATYVGRGTPLGNPFVRPKGAPPGSTLERYEAWLRDKIVAGDRVVCDALNDVWLRDGSGEEVLLMCSCHPKPCHAHVIKRVVEEVRR